MICASQPTPSVGELSTMASPGFSRCLMKRRAPCALTFSVEVLSFRTGPPGRRISTLTVLAIRFSDRPPDMNPLSARELAAPGRNASPIGIRRFQKRTPLPERFAFATWPLHTHPSRIGQGWSTSSAHYVPVAFSKIGGQADRVRNFLAGEFWSTPRPRTPFCSVFSDGLSGNPAWTA